jgi:hypothetical protein
VGITNSEQLERIAKGSQWQSVDVDVERLRDTARDSCLGMDASTPVIGR